MPRDTVSPSRPRSLSIVEILRGLAARRRTSQLAQRRSATRRDDSIATPVDVLEDRKLLSATANYKIDGIDFSPYIAADENGSNGASGQITEQEMRNRIAAIAPYTEWIRTYSEVNDLKVIAPIAHSMGLKVAVTAWLNGSSEDQGQIDTAIQQVKQGYADMIIIGSETLARGNLTPQQLIDRIKDVKKTLSDAGKSVPVAVADVWTQLRDNPGVMDAADVVMANFYPFQEGIKVDDAVEKLRDELQELTIKAGKKVWIGETGWPSEGNTVGDAVPSGTNAAKYFQNVVSMARAENTKLFYFGAYDEQWLETANGNAYAGHWGLADKDKNLKPGNEVVFDGQTLPFDWVTSTSGKPNLDGAYITSSGKLAQIIQSGNTLAFVNGSGKVTGGTFTDNTHVQAYAWGTTGTIDMSTADDGRIVFSDGTVWTRITLGGQYIGSSGNLTSIEQHGFVLKLTNASGGTSTAEIVDGNTVFADAWNLTGTITKDGAIKWSNGTLWNKLDLSENYKNAAGDSVHVYTTGPNSLKFVNKDGGTSSGKWINTTQVIASDWNQVGTVINGQIQWANGSVWNSALVLQGTTGSGGVSIESAGGAITLKRSGSLASSARITGLNTIYAADWNLTGTRSNGKITWSDGSVWSNFDFNDLNALFTGVDIPAAAPRQDAVEGLYFVGTQQAQILRNGTQLTFVNPAGQTSSGSVTDGVDLVATDWGNLQGTFDPVTGAIKFTDGTVWTKVPDVSGKWINQNNQETGIKQLGTDLTLTSAQGNTTTGKFVTATDLVLQGWGPDGGNLTGKLSADGSKVRWSNGNVWYLIPDLAGNWANAAGDPTQIEQVGSTLIFVNKSGGKSTGKLIDANHVVQTDWGNVIGTIQGDSIYWSNGTVWSTAEIAAGRPDIAGLYDVANGSDVRVMQAGDKLTFVNRYGQAAAGRYISNTEFFIDAWNTGGTISGSTIAFTSGNVWTKLPDVSGPMITTSGFSVGISQLERTLWFTTEAGVVVKGKLVNPTQVIETEGPLRSGSIGATGIAWDDGRVWQEIADLRGNWTRTSNGKATYVLQSGTSLLFVDETGKIAKGQYNSSLQVQIAAGSAFGAAAISVNTGVSQQLAFDNGWAWQKAAPSELDEVFSDSNLWPFL